MSLRSQLGSLWANHVILFLALNGGDKENKGGHLVILPGAPHYDALLLLAGKNWKLGFTGFTGFTGFFFLV